MRRTRSVHSSRLRTNVIPCEIVNAFYWISGHGRVASGIF